MSTTKKNIFSTDSITTKLEAFSTWLREKKSLNLFAINLEGKASFTDGFIVATATSVRHAQGLADHVLSMAKAANYEYLRMEGYQPGQWILLDFNDLVVSILLPAERELYRLEDLWAEGHILYNETTESGTNSTQ